MPSAEYDPDVLVQVQVRVLLRLKSSSSPNSTWPGNSCCGHGRSALEKAKLKRTRPELALKAYTGRYLRTPLLQHEPGWVPNLGLLRISSEIFGIPLVVPWNKA